MFKKLLSETALYGLSSMVGRALNYLLVPFYTKIFAPEAFGIVTELYAYIAFLNVVFTYGMETAYFRFATKDSVQKDTIYNVSLSAIMFSSMVLSMVLVVFAQPIANALQYPDQAYLIAWIALILAIDAIVAIPFARLRLEGKAAYFASAKLANIMLNIGLNYALLVFIPTYFPHSFFGKPDVSAVFLANLLANAMLIPILFRLFLVFRFKLNLSTLKPMLQYAYPLLFMGLAGMVNEVLDRILLKQLLPENYYPGISTLAAVGIYGACYKLSIFMSLAIQAFRYASEPFFFARSQDKNAPDLYARVMHWFVIVCAFIFLLICLHLDSLQFILRQASYRTGLGVVPVLLLANLFLGVYYNLSVWYKLTDKTYFGTTLTFVGAGITLVFNFTLIPIMGYMGAAYATLICYASIAALSYYFGNKYFPVPYKTGSALMYIGVAVLLVTLQKYVVIQEQWLGFFVANLFLLPFVVLVYLKEIKSNIQQ
jgi:O-antigen/teichoic acid export membrane protein